MVLFAMLCAGSLLGMIIADAVLPAKQDSPGAIVVGELVVEVVIPDEAVPAAPTMKEEHMWSKGEVELMLDGVVFSKLDIYYSDLACPGAPMEASWVIPFKKGWYALPVYTWKTSEVYLFMATLAQEGEIEWDTKVQDEIKKYSVNYFKLINAVQREILPLSIRGQIGRTHPFTAAIPR